MARHILVEDVTWVRFPASPFITFIYPFSLIFLTKFEGFMMTNYKKIAIIAGGVIAIVGQFYGANYFLPLIGGAVSAVSGLLLE